MPATWVFMAVPLGLMTLAYLLNEIIHAIREQRYLHAVFDGDRIQQWRSDRYNYKHSGTHHSGRRFY